MRISPSTIPADVVKVEKYLRKRSNGELTQIITSPATALLNRLPGFTVAHLRTTDERVIVGLAQEELNRRNTERSWRRWSWLSSLPVSIVSGVIVAALVWGVTASGAGTHVVAALVAVLGYFGHH